MSFSQNPNGPRGFAPVRAASGTPSRSNEYEILGTYATKIYSGQPVTLFTDGYVRVLVAATDVILGVFDGVEYIDTNGDTRFSPYWPAPGAVKTGTKVKARVFDNPDEQFLIKSTANLVQTNVGEFADLSPGLGTGGDDTTGKSTASLDAANTDTAITANSVVVINEISKRDGTTQLAIVQFARPKRAGIVGA